MNSFVFYGSLCVLWFLISVLLEFGLIGNIIIGRLVIVVVLLLSSFIYLFIWV